MAGDIGEVCKAEADAPTGGRSKGPIVRPCEYIDFNLKCVASLVLCGFQIGVGRSVKI